MVRASVSECKLENIQPSRCKEYNRLLKSIQVTELCKGATSLEEFRLILVNYKINESTMTFSDLLIENQELADSKFNEDVMELAKHFDLEAGCAFISPNNSLSRYGCDIPLPSSLELIESISGPGPYSIVELGCCRTYSYGEYGTHTLTGAIMIWRQDWKDLEAKILNIFEKS
jgi:hypothetical protein